ncbi:MAG TPA: hypothetical protein VFZ44_10300 [Pyrinomonadaceae bacterium]
MVSREGETDSPAAMRAAGTVPGGIAAPAPKPVWPSTAIAVLALVVSVAPTLYDYIYITVLAGSLDRVAALGLVALVGALLTLGASGCADAAAHLHATNRYGLVGGLLVGVGLGLMRGAHAEGKQSVAFAVALTAAEVWGAKLLRLGRVYPAALRCLGVGV